MSGAMPLCAQERETISCELSRKKSARYIAKLLGRHHSAISREINRNGGVDKGGAKGYRFSPGQRAAYLSGLDQAGIWLLGRPLSAHQGDFLLVKCFFFLALMRPADSGRHDKHIKWQYRRALFEIGLEQYEFSCAIRTETFPTLAQFTNGLDRAVNGRPGP